MSLESRKAAQNLRSEELCKNVHQHSLSFTTPTRRYYHNEDGRSMSYVQVPLL
jgi:hypothetical protein